MCIKDQWRKCANNYHVEGYLQIHPRTMDASNGEASSKDENEYAPIYIGHQDNLSGVLMAGQNFTMTAKDPSADFYILKCTKTKPIAIKFERDEWPNGIKENSNIVEGLAYEKINGCYETYVLMDKKPTTLIYSHLV
ncbi:hypothetical protein L7F22_032724 [Adiantum nelumboides]|nr:hypothetical protein [Adiantum nelumboides]